MEDGEEEEEEEEEAGRKEMDASFVFAGGRQGGGRARRAPAGR